MALQLNINITEYINQEWLTFKELTGLYSLANTTGWGAPNPATSSATAATLEMQDINGNSLGIVDVFTYFPTSDTNFELNILASDFDSSITKFNDGVYQFIYRVVTPTGNYEKRIWIVFKCAAECKMQNLLLKLVQDFCDTCEDDGSVLKYTQARMILDAAESAAQCGDIIRANALMDMFNRLKIEYCCD